VYNTSNRSTVPTIPSLSLPVQRQSSFSNDPNNQQMSRTQHASQEFQSAFPGLHGIRPGK